MLPLFPPGFATPGISWPVNLDYSVLEVGRGAETSRDRPGISWPVDLDYSVLEVARGC